MSRFANGQIPAGLLVEVGPYHWMPAATASRWYALVEDIRRTEGVTMVITPGKNAYRDYEGQVFARRNACAEGNCLDAADPGTSSHGGEYRGRDSQAIDVANWGVLGMDKWYAYCRKHGFEPGFFDWEPWHIIDWSPWVMPAGGKAEDVMNAAQEATLNQLAKDVNWLKSRIGGKDSEATLTSRITGIGGIVQWIKERVGGSTKTAATVADELRGLRPSTEADSDD